VYSWIWNHLPFGLRGKIIGSLLLTAAVGLVLWYGVFPAAEPLLPFGDVQVSDSGAPGDAGDTVNPSATSASTPTAAPRPSR
jgi:hypothetical protein